MPSSRKTGPGSRCRWFRKEASTKAVVKMVTMMARWDPPAYTMTIIPIGSWCDKECMPKLVDLKLPCSFLVCPNFSPPMKRLIKRPECAAQVRLNWSFWLVVVLLGTQVPPFCTFNKLLASPRCPNRPITSLKASTPNLHLRERVPGPYK
jgi:hypothetical protein